MKPALVAMFILAGCAAGPSEAILPHRGTSTPSIVHGQLVDPTVTRIDVRPVDGSAPPPRADATLAAESIRADLRDHMGDLLRCYWRSNRARGTVDVHFRLDAEGRAQNVRAHGVTLTMSTCIRDLVTRIPFEVSAEPGIEVALRLPFYERGGLAPLAFQQIVP
jgi:hypothetical protein